MFDSLYDSYRGVIAYIRVFSGALKAGDMMLLMSNGIKSEIKEVGVFTPKMEKVAMLKAGDVGYIVSNIKTTADMKTGDGSGVLTQLPYPIFRKAAAKLDRAPTKSANE